MLTACALGACTFVSAKPQVQPEPERQQMTTFYSHGTARDGDDLVFSVRMNGFDAPERVKVCGEINVWSVRRQVICDKLAFSDRASFGSCGLSSKQPAAGAASVYWRW
jgi:hypothetical protein